MTVTTTNGETDVGAIVGFVDGEGDGAMVGAGVGALVALISLMRTISIDKL